MAAVVTMRLQISVMDDEGRERADYDRQVRFASAMSGSGKREVVSLTGSAFTTITCPTGAEFVLIAPAAAAVSLVLKGVTGDTGIGFVPASTPVNQPTLLGVGAASSFGILNSGSTVNCELLWY